MGKAALDKRSNKQNSGARSLRRRWSSEGRYAKSQKYGVPMPIMHVYQQGNIKPGSAGWGIRTSTRHTTQRRARGEEQYLREQAIRGPSSPLSGARLLASSLRFGYAYAHAYYCKHKQHKLHWDWCLEL